MLTDIAKVTNQLKTHAILCKEPNKELTKKSNTEPSTSRNTARYTESKLIPDTKLTFNTASNAPHNIIKQPQKGFTLVEVLICLLLGSLLLSMVIGLYVTNVSHSTKTLQMSRLRTDLQALVGVIENDIRRAGYGGDQFMVGAAQDKVIDSSNTNNQKCIVYSYNYDDATTPTTSHVMGFRYSTNSKSIQFGRNVDPQASNCLNGGYWVNLTDPNFLKITALSFIETSHTNPTSQITLRSININITGELVENSAYSYQIATQIQVRNREYH
ncbi:prepilin-type N-terminal cleavage/methylation domain-containing protein [uncultured Psychromonas sp.]|uniref:PilW family protein n=1 Tax=uncultured Psychromonas sp. TaxID=173974 RepID=UPI002630262C|nr:prepilin-type N-terminal cleavage/methylation domain-containing protein [uncultured Psychromonas sp.]